MQSSVFGPIGHKYGMSTGSGCVAYTAWVTETQGSCVRKGARHR